MTLRPVTLVPSCSAVFSPEEVLKLAKLWDSKSLLHLHRCGLEHGAPHELTRILNCLKDQHTDRQIGDRRGRNFTEGRLQAASKTLPNGPDFLEPFLSLDINGLAFL